MNKQFEKLTVELLFKNKISVRGLFILDDNRYLYQIFNNCVEEWYMIHCNSFIKLKIAKHIMDNNNKTRKIIFNLGDDTYISLNMKYELNENNTEKISIKLKKNGERYYTIKDSYLNNMFLDIYRMNI